MTLNDWIVSAGISQAEFARQMGVSAMTVSDVLRGKYRFGPENARKASALTGGAVTLEELLFPDDFKKASGE